MNRPEPNEYAVFYKGYIDHVPDGDIVSYLERQSMEFVDFLKSLKGKNLLHRYAENKWTIAEVLGHIIDTERVMAYRLMRFSRNDKTPVTGFDQDVYVRASTFNSRTLDSIVMEFEGLRVSNLQMIKSLTEEQSRWTGEANEKVFSVRALVYIIAGHLNHHWTILKDRYL